MSVLSEIIHAEIAQQGAIPFARFMELALYCPDYGFYERESDRLGRAGDFYTSVSVGSLFGELLAFQFAGWLEEQAPGRLQIVESGAHDGTLAADVLRWLAQHRPALNERVEYVIAEPSPRRRAWQRKTLAEFEPQVRWVETGLAQQVMKFSGVIFANELLDALPVHRIGWDAQRGRWFEWGVAWDERRFGWVRLASPAPLHRMEMIPDELLAILPDGFTTEVCPAAQAWWFEAAQALQSGWLMTLDYGLRQEDFFVPHRREGTLRAYRQQQVCRDVLADPGEQDITAHVNFSQIQAAGERAGLRTVSFGTQAECIAGILNNFWGEGTESGAGMAKRARELQTLMHPEHLGRAFRVLVQRR